MKILADIHCHTNVSTHAYSTIKEMAECAAARGLEAMAMTNHAPALPDSAHLFHFQGIHSIPRKICGVTILRGVECSLTDKNGGLDLPERELEHLEIVIASIHSPVYLPKSKKEQTNAWLNVIENPLVDILGHLGRERTGLDAEEIVKKAKAYNKLIEINAHTVNYGSKADSNCREIIRACKKYDVPIVVNSDAHICYNVGAVDHALSLLAEVDYDEELVMNTSLDKILNFLKCRKNILL